MILFVIGILALYCAAVIGGVRKGFSGWSILGMTIGFGIITAGVLGIWSFYLDCGFTEYEFFVPSVLKLCQD